MTVSPRAFVIGHPIAHSRSPLVHRYWLDRLGLAGSYEAIDVPPDALAGFIADLRQGAFAGGNVTIPHKQAVAALCDEIDEAARAIGAVNTLVARGGRIAGSNSDWIGFAANLDAAVPGWNEKGGRAIVLGAGGAARGVILALIRRGFDEIVLLNRTGPRAAELSAHFAPLAGMPPRVGALEDFAAHAGTARLLVNTTAIGMHGSRFQGLDLAALPKTAIVSDIVYTPLETPLLAEAHRLGLKTVDGLGMLLYQAVPGFAAWFGVTPEVTPGLRQLIEKSL